MSRNEEVVLTTLCMVYNENKILLQDKVKDWVGLTFPGGHIEKEEPFTVSVIREVFEETGLKIQNPKLCGIKQFLTQDNIRYVVFLYKTNEFEGRLISSEEGKVFWLTRDDLTIDNTASGFFDVLRIMDNESITEVMYCKEESDSNTIWTPVFFGDI